MMTEVGGQELPRLAEEVLKMRLKSAMTSVVEQSIPRTVKRFIDGANRLTPEFQTAAEEAKERLLTAARDPKQYPVSIRFCKDIDDRTLRVGYNVFQMMQKPNKEGVVDRSLIKKLRGGQIGLADLRELNIFYRIICGRCDGLPVEADEKRKETLKPVPQEKQEEIKQFLMDYGQLMGDPLVRAIIDSDKGNQSRW